MDQLGARANPVRYSFWLTLLLTVCLMFAEHQAVWLKGDIDADYLVSEQSGNLARQLAYIILGLVGTIGIYVACVSKRRQLLWNRTLTTLLALLLGWCLLSVLWSAEPAVTAKRLLVLALMLIGAFGVTISWTRQEVLRFLALSSALQITIDVCLEIVYGLFSPWRSGYHFAGTLASNRQGYVCMVASLSSLCIARAKPPNRWFYQLLALYGFVFLVLTRSRGGLLAFACALLLYFAVTLDWPQRIATGLCIGIVMLASVMSGVAPVVLSFLDRGGEGSADFNGRGPLWTELLVYAQRRPVLGYGYEDFWRTTTIDDISDDQGWAITGAHSGYVEGLLQLGWTGAILHTLALLACLYVGVRLFRRTSDYVYFLAAALCVVYLVGGLLEAILLVKTSEISFDFAILLCVLAVQPGRVPATGRELVREGWQPVDSLRRTV